MFVDIKMLQFLFVLNTLLFLRANCSHGYD